MGKPPDWYELIRCVIRLDVISCIHEENASWFEACCDTAHDLTVDERWIVEGQDFKSGLTPVYAGKATLKFGAADKTRSEEYE